MLLISKDNVDEFLPYITPGLERAEYLDDLGSTSTLQAVIEEVREGHLLGGYQPETGYALLFSVHRYPHKSFLFVFWGGKDPKNQVPINYEDMDSFLIECARVLGTSVIHVQGRKGWEKTTKHLGYSVETVNLFKEVPL